MLNKDIEKLNYSELMDAALDMLQDDDLYIDMVNELDSWNGYADDFRCYYMEELDDLFYGLKPTELLEKITSDFSVYDDYFYCSIWGIESTNDPAAVYRDHTDAGEVLDNIIDNYNNIYINDGDFDDLISEIIERRDVINNIINGEEA